MLSRCSSDEEIMQKLLTEDVIEVGLRHLGAHFYEARTKDRTGAAHMRAVSTPGVGKDVLPSWLVTEGTTFSKCEHQRDERVRADLKFRGGGEQQPGKGGKGKGKGHK